MSSHTRGSAAKFRGEKWGLSPNSPPPEYGDEFIDRDYGKNNGVLEIYDVEK